MDPLDLLTYAFYVAACYLAVCALVHARTARKAAEAMSATVHRGR